MKADAEMTRLFPSPSARRRILLAAAALVPMILAAGCAEHLSRRETVSDHGGDAKAANAAIHMIDPWPPGSEDTRIGMDGIKAQQAIERYHRPPPAPKTAATSITLTPAGDPPRQD
jgi:hypothetical protein